MDKDLKDQVILVTGASVGIGAAISRKLAERGAILALCSRDLIKLNDLVSDDIFKDKKFVLISQDLGTATGTEKCADAIIKEFGKIDGIVNNVGGPIGMGRFDELSDDNWIDTFNINVMSLVRLSRILIPYLIDSNTASIISISSIAASEPGYTNPHYSSSKASLTNFTKHLANILAEFGINVNSVSPGTILTPGFMDFINIQQSQNLKDSDSIEKNFMNSHKKNIPLGELGDTEAIASIVAFLLSSEARYITGSNFVIDGGKSRFIF